MTRPVLWTSLFAVAALTACENPDVSTRKDAEVMKNPAAKAAESPAAPDPAAVLRTKLDRFVSYELTADVSRLPASEREALDKLIAAARFMDPIFDRQADASAAQVRERLAADKTPLGEVKLEYWQVMRGPWDRQDHFAPFAAQGPRPPGAGFYPVDLTADDFKKAVQERPGDKAALESLTTVLRRRDGALVAVPYREEYREWLEPAAKALEEAAALTSDASLKKFLKSRAKAFLTDDYYQSDKDWMDLSGPVQITIGPYETYEDELLGLKASYEAFVTVRDEAASAALAKYKKYLPEMEMHLPIPDEMKTTRGAQSPIDVADLVFTAGDARKSVQTIAFNLPNDEKVRAEKGAKKVLLRNLIQAKFDMIMRSIADQVLHLRHTKHLSSEAFFTQVLFHELSHSLGPAFVTRGKEKIDVRVALEASYSPLEEAKADVMGVYNALYMIEKGELPEAMREPLLISYFAGLFRSVRFGVAEAHGRGAALQLNRFFAAGAATAESTSGKFTVDTAKLSAAITDLVRDICTIQHAGDKAAADKLLAELGKMTPLLERALGKLTEVPIDIRPAYPLAGEVLPK